jgi:molybdopterin synthase catalytic subunit
VIFVTAAPIAPQDLVTQVQSPGDGAVASFLGVVRDHSGETATSHLVYEAYTSMAERVMGDICAEAAARWPVGEVAVVHRVGRLEVGECSVAIAVASPHRDAAFRACRYIIDEIKTRVPIWKKEVGPDGESWTEGPGWQG